MTTNLELIDFPVIADTRGDLTFVEGDKHVPFAIARVYYIYNMPVDTKRGGHAHRQLEQVILALSGSFRITLDDGTRKESVWLRNPRQGLRVGQMVWHEMDSFSQGAVCMAFASHPYEEADYYRDYGEFRRALEKNAQ